MTITAFESSDDRSFDLQVAGPAAFLTAKAIKINERLRQVDSQPDRLKERDALDAFRLLRAIDTQTWFVASRSTVTTSTPPQSPTRLWTCIAPTPPPRKDALRSWLRAQPKATRRLRQRCCTGD